MNLSVIAREVAKLVPCAKNVRTRDAGGHVHALVCEIDGKTHSVMFDATGLYGQSITGMFQDWPKSDLHIAAEIAKELRK